MKQGGGPIDHLNKHWLHWWVNEIFSQILDSASFNKPLWNSICYFFFYWFKYSSHDTWSILIPIFLCEISYIIKQVVPQLYIIKLLEVLMFSFWSPDILPALFFQNRRPFRILTDDGKILLQLSLFKKSLFPAPNVTSIG